MHPQLSTPLNLLNQTTKTNRNAEPWLVDSSGFRSMLGVAEERAPLRRNVTQSDVANTALFLCSPLAAGITGEVVHVDSGYNIVGM